MSGKPYQRGEGSHRLFQTFRIDDLVPEDHLLRRIDAVLDLDFIRDRVRDTYDQESTRGRPPWDPVLLYRMMLLSFLFDLSENRLEQEVRMHAGYRWFLGLDFDDPVPDRTTLIKARQRWGMDTFEEIFGMVVTQCAEAGLVQGENLVADGTQVRARASVRSLERQVYAYCEFLREDEENGDDDPPPNPPRRAGDPDFRGESFRNDTHRSRTDPQALLYRKGSGQEAFLRYLAHYVIDQDTGVILGAAASRAHGRAEREVATVLLEELRKSPYLSERPHLYMDRGYREGSFLANLLRISYLPHVRLPGTAPEIIPRWKRGTNRLDWIRKRIQKVQLAKARNVVRSLTRGSGTSLERARVRVEHTFAEAKEWHGLRRAQGYGLQRCHWQVLMTATAQNLKRLARGVGRRGKTGAVQAIKGVLSTSCLLSMAMLRSLDHILAKDRVWLNQIATQLVITTT